MIVGHPTPAEYDVLGKLLGKFGGIGAQAGAGMTTFLESDLGVQMPLHISLSKPLSLSTEEKDGFERDVRGAVAGCGVQPFVSLSLSFLVTLNP